METIEVKEVKDLSLEFKCPDCNMRGRVPVVPEQVAFEIIVQPCPEHGQHVIISISFNCPHCNETIAINIVEDEEGDLV